MRRSRLLMCGFGFVLVMISQVPLFVLANEIDGDEWQKFGTGVVMATIAAVGVLAREVWRFASKPPYGTRNVTKTCGVPIVDDTSGYD